MPAVFSQPPPEILHEIFLRALPHPDFVDPRVATCIKSTWHAVIRQKKSIILVCQAWYDMGLPFLYQDIFISGVHQLPHLYRTLNEAQSGVQRYIRRLRISAPMLNPTIRSLFENLLDRLFHLCPSLSSLEFLDLCGSFRPLLSRNIISNIQIPPNITHLSLSESITMRPDVIIDLLVTVQENITHLYIYNFSKRGTIAAISFPSLIDLTIVDSPADSLSTDIFKICSDGFYCFPALIRVKFIGGSWPSCDSSMAKRVLGFCKKFGEHLKVLQLVKVSAITDSKLQQILEVCPELEHVAHQPNENWGILHHPRIQWVDFFEDSQTQTSKIGDLQIGITTENFPCLKGVRIISSSLEMLHPGIPEIIPPALSQDPGFAPCSFVFDCGLHIRHEVGYIFSPLCEQYEAEVDSDVDSTYSPSSSEGESDEEVEDDNDNEGDMEVEIGKDPESEGLMVCGLLETWLTSGS